MNGADWEKSKALTPLKKDFLKGFFSKERRFFLTGGSALGIFYFDHRYSYDLDFFTTDGNINWKEIEAEIREVAIGMDASYDAITRAPSFQRFQLKRGEDSEILDFVIEWVEQIEPKKNKIGEIIVDPLREIFVNKICTLLSRAEVKDVIDLYFLTKNGFNVLEAVPLAQKKDGGLDPATLSFVVSGIKVKELPEYLIREVSLEELNGFLSRLKTDLAEMAFPAFSANHAWFSQSDES